MLYKQIEGGWTRISTLPLALEIDGQMRDVTLLMDDNWMKYVSGYGSGGYYLSDLHAPRSENEVRIVKYLANVALTGVGLNCFLIKDDDDGIRSTEQPGGQADIWGFSQPYVWC